MFSTPYQFPLNSLRDDPKNKKPKTHRVRGFLKERIAELNERNAQHIRRQREEADQSYVVRAKRSVPSA